MGSSEPSNEAHTPARGVARGALRRSTELGAAVASVALIVAIAGCASEPNAPSPTACPAATTVHPVEVSGIWRLKLLNQTGECPAELGVQPPLIDGDYRLSQLTASLELKPMSSSAGTLEIPLVDNGYCHRRDFTYNTCELYAAGVMTLSTGQELRLSYRLNYERNDHPLCPAGDLPMSCQVKFEYAGFQLAP